MMHLNYDPAKNARNLESRGLSFDQVEYFDWSTALLRVDDRFDYGERRFQAYGYIDDRLHVLIFTPRGAALHVISLRKANKREVKLHEQKA